MGQAFIAYFTWTVLADYIAVLIESRPLTYSAFWIIFLHQEASLLSIFRTTRSLSSRQVLPSAAALIFLTLALLFTLAFPTLAGAMTGYVGSTEGFIRDYNGSYIKFSDFDLVAYIIHDGDRIAKSRDFIIPYHSVESTG